MPQLFFAFHADPAYPVTQPVTQKEIAMSETQKRVASKEIASDAGIRSLPLPKAGRIECKVRGAPGLYLRAGPRGKKWYLRAREPGTGKPIAILVGPYGEGELALTLKAAKRRAEEWQELLRGGTDPRDDLQKARNNTFSSARDAFLERHQTAKGRDWSPNTLKQYRLALHHKNLMAWSQRPVSEITTAMVQQHINSLEADGHYTAARRHIAYLRAFFKWCQRKKQGFLPGTAPLPTAEIEIEQPKDTARKRFLSERELRSVWIASQRLGPLWGPFIRVLILTGQRISEVAGMRRDAVADNIWTQATNKADRMHLVPLSEQTVAELTAVIPIEIRPEETGGTLVEAKISPFYFTTKGDRPVSGFSKAKARLDAQIEKQLAEGETMASWTYHDLRRTMTTHLRRMNTPQAVCSKLLNHGEHGVTSEHYDMYDMLDEKTRAMNVWGRYVEQLVAEQKDCNVVEFAPRSIA